MQLKRIMISILMIFLFSLSIINTTGQVNSVSDETFENTETDTTVSLSLDYIEHDPIAITSNTDFVSQGFPGSGTSINPYRIEGYNITGGSYLIKISGTTAYFIIQNNFISSADSIAIYLASTINGQVFNNTIIDSRSAIELTFSSYNAISSNVLNDNEYGIYLYCSSDNTVSSNTIDRNGYGILLFAFLEYSASYNIISSNTISNSRYYGIYLEDASSNTIEMNDFFYNYASLHYKAQAYDNRLDTIFQYNYWSGWILPDNDSNGIVDNPYIIDGSYTMDIKNQDNYPVVSPNKMPYDTDVPELDSPSDIQYVYESTGHTISWTVGDEYPKIYNITLDEVLYVSDTIWSNGIIVINADGLSVGTHNITIYLYDISGNLSSDSVIVTVVEDIKRPDLDSPSDIQYVYGSTGHTISWTVSDICPGVFNITLDGVLYISDTIWSNGTIVINADGLSVGTHNITIYLYDISGNLSSDSVIVTVMEADIPDLDSPSDIQYVYGSTGHTISWTVSDAYPKVYNVTLDGVLYVSDTTWSNGTITINVDGLSVGTHSITINVYDSAGNFASDSVTVTVLEDTTTGSTDTTDTTTRTGLLFDIYIILSIVSFSIIKSRRNRK